MVTKRAAGGRGGLDGAEVSYLDMGPPGRFARVGEMAVQESERAGVGDLQGVGEDEIAFGVMSEG